MSDGAGVDFTVRRRDTEEVIVAAFSASRRLFVRIHAATGVAT
jgi:hypothetical protein